MRKWWMVSLITVAIVFSFSVFFAGSAAQAVNGIRIFINGQEGFPDTPPTMVNYRTMVPLRFVAEALGAKVEWDDASSTVNITSDVAVKKPTVTAGDIAILKLYSRIAENYRVLDAYGETLHRYDSLMYIASNYISANDYNGFLNLNITETLDERIIVYNALIEPTKSLVLKATPQGIDISDMLTMLTKYSQAIDYYKAATTELYKDSAYRDMQAFYGYLSTSQLGFELAAKQMETAFAGYLKYYYMLQSWTSQI